MGKFFSSGSWKTTAFGIGAGAFNLLANGSNWKQVLFSAGLAFLGAYAQTVKAPAQLGQ